MNPYFAGSLLLTMLAFLTGLMIYSNRAGRNGARLQSSREDTATDRATARTAQAMLTARTNGLRSKAQLLQALKRGTF